MDGALSLVFESGLDAFIDATGASVVSSLCSAILH